MRKQSLRVSVPVFWVRSSSSNVYQMVKISSVNIKKVKYSNYKLSAKHAPSRSNNSGYNDSQVHGNILTVTPRIHHHFQKFCVDSNTKYIVFRIIDRLSEIDFLL